MNSWNLGTISGIRIRVHWTFLILPIWIYFSSILAGSGATAALMSLIFVLAIFGCVLLHELGHALAARQFGISTRDITLLPIGGVAALERMPREPKQELWIAVAGPLVNIVIAMVLGAILLGGGFTASTIGGGFLWQLAFANVALVVFNMLPAFPMDGGRVLRSILAMFMDWLKATQIAVRVGNIVAIGLGLLGILSGNLMLAFVALFVFVAARAELMSAVAADRQKQSFGSDSGCVVPASLTVSSVAAWLASRRADACRVVEHDKLIGTITRSELVAALSNGLGNTPVGMIVR
ncbi:MAG: Zn-dependent protease [Mariniblastus sp.]|jgi:Zn-dependent protease